MAFGAILLMTAAGGIWWYSRQPGPAVAPESLSAQQLADLLAPSVRPKVTDLRVNDAMFDQVRRGGYELGLRYEL